MTTASPSRILPLFFRSCGLAVSLLALATTVLIPKAYASGAATTTALSILPTSPQTGGTVQTLTATVTVTSGGAAVTAGTVNFYDITSAANTNNGSTSFTARPLLIGTAQLKSSGTASIKVMLGGGVTHTLHAVYVATSADASSSSATVSDVISGGQHDPITLTETSSPNNGLNQVPVSYAFFLNYVYFGLQLPSGTMNVANTVTSASVGSTTNLNRQANGATLINWTSTGVAAAPRSVAVGDFNNDGKQDIVATNASAASVSVYLGNGDGTLGSQTTFATAAPGAAAPNGSFAGVAVGDFNNDGNLDIAVSNTSTGNISILLGNGNGTFQTHVEYNVAADPTKIVVGDFNEDGNLDLAVAGGTGNGGTVTLLLGTGSGTFTTGTSLTSLGTTDMVVADFNGDGHQDLLTDCYSCENFALFKGNGNGTFQTAVSGYPPALQDPWGLAVADFNGDGIPDIAFAAPGTNGGQVYFAINNGTGTFGAGVSRSFGVSVKYIAAADVNGDGWPDLIGTSNSAATVSVAAGDPSSASATAAGFLTPISITTTANPDTIATGDLTGAGLQSIVVATEAGYVNVVLDGTANEGAVGSPYFGETGILLTSTANLGTDTFATTYTPNSQDLYGTVVSNTATVPVYGSVTPSLVLTQSTITYGQSSTLNVTVPELSNTYPTGTEQILTSYYQGTLLDTITLANGAGSYTISHPNAGTYNYYGIYSGDTNYVGYGPGFTPVVLTVNPETPTISLGINPTSQIVQGNVTLTATVGVTANAEAGIVVNFNLNGNTGSCTTNSSGVCSAQVAVPAQGANSASATVQSTQNLASATANYSGSISGYQVTSAPVLSSSANPSFTSQNVTITATVPAVSGIVPTGTVIFTDGNGNTLATSALVSGAASFSTSAFALGTTTITAAYSGDTTYLAANSAALSQVVAAPTISNVLTSTATVAQGNAATLTATVSNNGAAINPGLVTFYDTTSTPQLLGVASLNSSGVAALKLVLSPGTHSITAVFGGNGPGLTSVSSNVSHTTVTPSGTAPTTASISLSGSPGSYTLTGTASFPGKFSPTGSISFLDATNGNAVLGTGTIGSLTSTLKSPVTYGVGAAPPDVLPIASATGDLNGDGIPDLVVANYNDGNCGGYCGGGITVLRGNGNGTFTVLNNLTVPGPNGIVLADLNGDGFLDIFYTNDYNNVGCTMLGDGTGNFTGVYPCVNGFGNTYGIAIADFNKDGILDVAVTNNSGTVNYFNGTGDGTFNNGQSTTNVSVGNGATGITTGDYNGDGNPDFITTNSVDGTISVVLGNGDGTFQSAVTYTVGTYPNSIVTGDFNADGKQDIAVTNQVDHTVGILLGNGDGTFQAMTTYNAGANGPGAISLADIDGDGKADLVVSNSVTIQGYYQVNGNYNYGPFNGINNYGNTYDNQDSDNTLGIFHSNGNGTFAAMTTVSTGASTVPYGATVGDFNGDGLVDLAVPFAAADQVGVFLGTATGTATLTGSAVNNAGPVLVKDEYTAGTSDSYASSAISSNSVQLQGSSVPTLASSLNPAGQGSSVTFTATVATLGGVAPTGTVQFKDGSTSIGSAQTLSSGSASYTTSSLSIGNHSITAVYSGNSVYATTTSNALSQVVTAPTTSVNLATSQTPVASGVTVTFTATLGSNTATGTVAFKDGGTIIGSGTVSSGVASFQTSSLTVGSHSITAVYSGDSNYATSTSSALSQVITLPQTSVTLATSGTPVGYGTSVTFTATLGSNTATGTVQFEDGSTVIGTGTVASGVATFTTSSLSVGTHSITAVYSGNSSYATSTSSALSQVINLSTAATVTLATSHTPVSSGTSVTFTATLGASAATGTVQFKDSATLLGTGTVASGVATYSTSSLSVGTHSITAIYSGDSNYATTTSSVLSQVISPPVPIVVLSTPANVADTTAVTMTATVTLSGSPVTLGLVNFYDASSVPSLLGTESLNSSGVATLYTVLGVGTHTITAVLEGTGAGLTSESSTPGTTVVAPPSPVTPTPVITLTGSLGSYGLTGTFTFPVSTLPTGNASFIATNAGNANLGTASISTPTPGTFLSPVSYANQYPSGESYLTVVGDYNGDGIPDLIMADYAAGYIFTIAGNGDGTFSGTPSTLPFANASDVKLVDINGDGNLDVCAISDVSNTGECFFGSGSPYFNGDTVGMHGSYHMTAFEFADFNKDGKLDSIVTNHNSVIQYFQGNGNGTFGNPVSTTPTRTLTGGTEVNGVTVGDYNGDGNPDFIVTNSGDNTIGVFLGDGTGHFATMVTYATGNYPNHIVTGDFNGDGKLDVAVTNQNDHTIGVFLGNGDGTFQSMVTYTAGANGPGNLTLGDVNGDGKADILVVNTVTVSTGVSGSGDSYGNASDNTVGIFLGNGDGTFQTMKTISTGSGTVPYSVKVADFNGDGLPDIVTANSATGSSAVYLNTSVGTATLSGSAVNNAGPATVIAQYNAGTNDIYSTTDSSNHVQLTAASVPTLSSSVNPSAQGASVTFTMTVPPLGNITASGTIGLYDGATLLSSGSLSSGSRTYTTTTLAAGAHTLTAHYAGNGGYLAEVSTALTQNVGPSITLTSNHNPASYGTLITFTATLGTTAATGTVTFYDSSTALGTGTVSSGVATFQTAALTGGSHSITAVYSGDSNYSGSTSSVLTQTISLSTTATTALATSGTPAAYGTNVTFTATLGNSAATGTVTFKDGATVLGTGTVSAGVATFSTTSLSIATHSITAVYSGDTNFSTTTSSALSQVITLITPVLSAPTASPTSSSYGAPVTLTQTVPTGTPGPISFYAGSQLLGTATISGGVATLVTSAIPAGSSLSITATSPASGNYAAATSSALSFAVTAATTATTLAVTSGGSPVSTVASGSVVTLTATVLNGSNPIPLGTVNFCDATANYCTDQHLLGTGQLTSAGTASISFVPGKGNHSYKAIFLGTSNGSGSSSTASALSVTGGLDPTTTTISSSGSSGNYTLNATVVGVGSPSLTGLVNFLDTSNANASVASATVGASTRSLSSTTASTPTVGTNPWALAAGDFNGDGILDLLTASYANNTMQTQLGNGSGTFTAQTAVSTGTGPIGVAVGDLNGDGLLDAVSVNQSAGTVSVFEGDGTGNFTLKASPSVGNSSTPKAVAVADFNGDGILDIVTANYSNNNVTVFLGTGNFAYAAGVSYATGTHPEAITVGDVNGDGYPDIVAANYGSASVSVLLGRGDGTFLSAVSYTVGISPLGVALGDFNGDGHLDIVTTSSTANTATVLLNSGTGTFTLSSTVTVDLGPWAVTVGDFNGDGLLDFATANNTAGDVSVALGNGSGGFTVAAGLFTVGSLDYRIVAGDVNGDGIPDLVTANYAANTASVLLMSPKETATATASNVAVIGTGTHTVLASYPGDTNYAASQSSTVNLTGSGALATTTALSASPTSSALGSPVTLTATVTPGSAQGYTANGDTVTFYNGSTSLGTGTLSGGVATLTTSALPLGTDSLKAAFPGDSHFLTSTSTTSSYVVTTATTLVLTANPSSASYGASVTLTATLSPYSAQSHTTDGEVVTFLNGSTSLGTGTLASGVATLTISTLPGGSDSITASYPGDSTFSASTASAFTVTISQATPTLAAPTASPSGAAYGTSVTLTQAVPAGATGTISFYSGSTLLGTGTIANGVATLTTSALPGGTNSITTQYGGNSNYTSATSAAGSVIITPATLTLAAPTASPTSANYGTSVTLTQAVPTGATGSVSFYSGSTLLGTGAIVNGVATLTTSSLPGGANSITTQYGGNANYTSATSAAGSVTINPATPTLAAPTASPSGGPYGTSVTLTQAVPAGATGTVSFYSGSTLLGSGTIANGVATLTTTSLPAGTNSITTQYGGNANYTAATSAAGSVAITQVTPTLAAPTASPTTANAGASVTLTQAVPTGVTGSITFSAGSTVLGTAPIVNGVATLTTTSIPAGINSITGSFAGNTNYTAATSAPTTVTINGSGAATTTSLSVSPATSVYGTPVTLTSSVVSGGNPVTTGTVTFYSGGVAVGTAPVNGNGVASLTLSTLTGGANAITAGYAGTSSYNASVSSASTATVTPATPTLAAPTASPSGAPYGTSVTLTQAVPAGATGTVSFYSGSTLLGTGTIANGVATLTTTSLPAGTNSITTQYGGNANYTAATSAAGSVAITQVTPTLAAPTASPTTANAGASVTLTQAVPTGVTGSITFSAGSTVLGTAPIVNGVATLTTTSIPAGINSITGSFAGNTNYTAATSAPTTVTINGSGAATTTSLSVSPATSVYGTPVTLTSSVVSGGNPVTTGNVTFYSGGVAVGTAPVNGNGVASLTLSTLTGGANAITAGYAGTSSYNASVSSASTATVTPATPTLATPTSSPSSAAVGAPVTLTQTVPAGATGTVSFYSGSTLLGTGTIVNGVATLTTTSLPVGANSITTQYGGNGNYTSATSPAASVTITPASPTLSSPTASPTGAAYGTPVTLSQTVPAGVTGTISFYSGSTLLGTGTIVNGVATLTSTSIPAGTNSITTQYAGNSNYGPATSAAGSVTITQATPVLAAPTSSPSSAAVGASVTLTQTVPAGATGTVSFYSGSTLLGTGTIVNGVATLTTTSLPVGTDSITTQYGGNGNYASATSAAGSVTITALATPGYTISANPPSLTIHEGATGSTVITVTPTGGFTGTFLLGCQNLPSNAVCQFMQNGAVNNTVVLNGNNQPVQTTLNVMTGMAVAQRRGAPGAFRGAYALLLPAGLVLLTLGRRRRELPHLARMAVLLLMLGGVLGALSGCSDGGFGVGSTPLGSSTVTVTATATASASATTNGAPATGSSLNLTITIIQ